LIIIRSLGDYVSNYNKLIVMCINFSRYKMLRNVANFFATSYDFRKSQLISEMTVENGVYIGT